MKTQLTLTPGDVKHILKEHLEKNGIKIVGEIKLEVGKELAGNQMNEYYTETFKGATCEVDILKPTPPTGPIFRKGV
jgi:hypothetical protein